MVEAILLLPFVKQLVALENEVDAMKKDLSSSHFARLAEANANWRLARTSSLRLLG